jgi:hypothetical protein
MSTATVLSDRPHTVPPTAECLAGAAGFIRAIETRDWTAAARTLHPEVEFLGPLEQHPRRGEYAVMSAIDALGRSVRNYRHTAVTGTSDHPVLHFAGRVGDVELSGAILLDVDELGMVDRITVLVRPMAALLALAGAAGRRTHRD